MKYLTVTDKDGKIVISLMGKFIIDGHQILNNDYTITVQNDEPVFTERDNNIVLMGRDIEGFIKNTVTKLKRLREIE